MADERPLAELFRERIENDPELKRLHADPLHASHAVLEFLKMLDRRIAERKRVTTEANP